MSIHKGNLRVVSTGSYLPDVVLSNLDLEEIVDTSDDWIMSRTGIKERRIAFEETTSDLAARAAEIAIIKAGFDRSHIDLIIVATFTPDYRSPSVASLVQAKLGLVQPNIIAFDINAACTGFIYALNTAEALLRSKAATCALVIGAEVISKVTDYHDRNTCVLFGDGAGAVILEADRRKEAFFNLASRPDPDLILYVDDVIHMDGQRVYQFASKVIGQCIEETLAYARLQKTGIKKVIPHQANIRIIQLAAKLLALPMDSFYVNIEKYGNTSAASIAIAFDELLSTHSVDEGDKVVLVGFGAGLTFGACLLTI